MSAMRWPVVIFDLDGTLADTIPLILASHDHATRVVLGREYSEAERLSWIGRTLWDIYDDIAPDKVDEIADVYTNWNRDNLHMIASYPGIGELMADLRASKVPVGVVTSKRRPAAKATLQAVGLNWVPVLAAAFETAEHKPSPLPLEHALTKLGARASDAVYVGDAVFDVQAAQAAGLGSIAVLWGAGTPADLASAQPSVLVRDVEELRVALSAG